MAPEVLSKNANYTSKVDVYASGIVLWELATGLTPYQGMDASTIVLHVQQYDIRPIMPADITAGIRDLMTQCWDRKPDVRPTFDEIVRRFESEKIGYHGYNRDEFLRYVKASATTGELLIREVERVIKKVVGGEVSLRDATTKLRSTGIPPDMLETVWTSLVGILGRFSLDDVAHYLLLFVKSSWRKDCIAILRSMEPGRIPPDVINAFVTEIPIGSQELDTQIIILACQNRAPDLCSVYATKPTDITLAFEMVARHGVDLQLRPAVIDRCVQSLGSANLDLTAAALKCLLSLHELKRINFQRLSLFVASTHRALAGCAFLAVGAMAADRTFPPVQLFDSIVRAMGSDPRAVLAVVPACRDAELAAHLLQLFEAEQPAASEAVLRALACAARHSELQSRIVRMLTDGPFSVGADKLAPAVARLLAKLSRTE
jgi:serine/threonine protein kinase